MATTTRRSRGACLYLRPASQPHPVYGHTIAILPDPADRTPDQAKVIHPFEVTFLRPGGGYHKLPRFHRPLSPGELRAWLHEYEPGDRPLVAYTARWTREEA